MQDALPRKGGCPGQRNNLELGIIFPHGLRLNNANVSNIVFNIGYPLDLAGYVYSACWWYHLVLLAILLTLLAQILLVGGSTPQCCFDPLVFPSSSW